MAKKVSLCTPVTQEKSMVYKEVGFFGSLSSTNIAAIMRMFDYLGLTQWKHIYRTRILVDNTIDTRSNDS